MKRKQWLHPPARCAGTARCHGRYNPSSPLTQTLKCAQRAGKEGRVSGVCWAPVQGLSMLPERSLNDCLENAPIRSFYFVEKKKVEK